MHSRPAALRTPAHAGSPIAPVTPPDYSGFIYGVAGQWAFDPGNNTAALLASAASNGVQMLRIDMGWLGVEAAAPVGGVHTYDWSTLDAHVSAAATAGLRVMPILWDAPQWAARYPVATYPRSTHSCVSAANLPDWIAYVHAVAARYGPSGAFWSANPGLTALPVTHYEIGNEMNAGDGKWWGTATTTRADWLADTTAATEYGTIFKPTYAEIKSVQPGATVFMGGLTGGPSSQGNPTWVQRVWAATPDLVVDAVAIHPYSKYRTNADAQADGQGASVTWAYPTVKQLRQALDAIAGVGPAMPLFITEAGWSVYTGTDPGYTGFSGTTFVPPDPQLTNWATNTQSWAQDAPRSDCNIRMLILHTLVTDEDSLTDREKWMGIWNRDGTMKAPATSYTTAIKLMRGQLMNAYKTTGLPLTGTVVF